MATSIILAPPLQSPGRRRAEESVSAAAVAGAAMRSISGRQPASQRFSSIGPARVGTRSHPREWESLGDVDTGFVLTSRTRDGPPGPLSSPRRLTSMHVPSSRSTRSRLAQSNSRRFRSLSRGTCPIAFPAWSLAAWRSITTMRGEDLAAPCCAKPRSVSWKRRARSARVRSSFTRPTRMRSTSTHGSASKSCRPGAARRSSRSRPSRPALATPSQARPVRHRRTRSSSSGWVSR